MSRLFIRICLVLAVVFSSQILTAQSLAQYVNAGNKELEAGYPKSALEYYQLALKLDTHFVPANYGAANAYRALRNYKRADAHYQEVVENDGEDEFLDANLYQGQMLMQLGKYAEAKRSLEYFIKAYRQRDAVYKLARDLQLNCDWAMEHANDTAKYEVSKPDSGLNTIHAEMSPIWFDSNTVYFSTMRYEKDIVRKKGGVFIEMKKAILDSNIWIETELDLPIKNKKAHVGNVSFSSDSSKFYYSRCEEKNACEIYVSKKNGDSWSEPYALASPVNEAGTNNTQPTSVKFDGVEYLIFSSNREGGKGGMDIWSVEIRDDNPTKLRNLGTRINTSGDEITPYFSAFDTTLYFASNLVNGYGGFDVFKAKGLPGTYNQVENLGPEINTSADDYYFMISAKDSTGYLTSNRNGGLKADGNETCCNDIYKVRLMQQIKPEVIDSIPADSTKKDTQDVVAVVPVERPIITQKDSGMVAVIPDNPNLPTINVPVTLNALRNVLPIKLFYHNDSPNPRTTSRTTTLTYLDTYIDYQGRKDEYLAALDMANLSRIERAEFEEQMHEFFDKELRTSISHLNAALDIIYSELKAGKNIELEIKGYASPLANSDYNLNLTYRRIDAIINYFESYDGGKLKPFVQNNQLVLNAKPFGESKAADSVSDLFNDKLGSIYSQKAAFERRIEIQRIEEN